MSKRLAITEAFLRLLAHSSTQKRKLLLAGATNEQFKGLLEVCLNLLRGNLPLGVKDKTKFRRNRHLIRSLANKRISIKKKMMTLPYPVLHWRWIPKERVRGADPQPLSGK